MAGQEVAVVIGVLVLIVGIGVLVLYFMRGYKCQGKGASTECKKVSIWSALGFDLGKSKEKCQRECLPTYHITPGATIVEEVEGLCRHSPRAWESSTQSPCYGWAGAMDPDEYCKSMYGKPRDAKNCGQNPNGIGLPAELPCCMWIEKPDRFNDADCVPWPADAGGCAYDPGKNSMCARETDSKVRVRWGKICEGMDEKTCSEATENCCTWVQPKAKDGSEGGGCQEQQNQQDCASSRDGNGRKTCKWLPRCDAGKGGTCKNVIDVKGQRVPACVGDSKCGVNLKEHNRTESRSDTCQTVKDMKGDSIAKCKPGYTLDVSDVNGDCVFACRKASGS